MEFLPTGNPFVDSGMYTMQARASELHFNKEVDILTPELLKEIMSDEQWLAKANRRLNSFFMISGTNYALVNPSTNKQAYKTIQWAHLDEAHTGWKEYL